MSLFVIFVFCWLVFFPQAHAARFTGAYLLKVCEMDARGKETVAGGHTACQAYIAGVIDYHTVLQSMHMAPQLNLCVPQNVPMNTLHDIVLAYFRAHTENDAFVAAPGVVMALYGAYPCR